MAREALAKKLAEEGMTAHEGATYQAYKRESEYSIGVTFFFKKMERSSNVY